MSKLCSHFEFSTIEHFVSQFFWNNFCMTDKFVFLYQLKTYGR